jgi:hypothetical protein
MLRRIVNCPACGYYNPPSQQTCAHCSLLLPIPAGDALCAVHPEVKATGACSRCGTFGCGDCLSQRGNDWLCAACLLVVGKLPWDERDSLGIWRAWWRTSVLLISAPVQTLSTAPPDGPMGGSMLFALLSTAVGFLPTILLGFPLIILGALVDGGGEAGGMAAVGLVAVMFIYGVMLFAMQLGSVLFIAALEHLSLMLLGTNPGSYSVTVRAHALGMAPFLLGLLPFCSFYVFPLWSMVVRIIAVTHLHKTTTGKAVAAVLMPIGLFCGGFALLYAAAIALAMGLSH